MVIRRTQSDNIHLHRNGLLKPISRSTALSRNGQQRRTQQQSSNSNSVGSSTQRSSLQSEPSQLQTSHSSTRSSSLRTESRDGTRDNQSSSVSFYVDSNTEEEDTTIEYSGDPENEGYYLINPFHPPYETMEPRYHTMERIDSINRRHNPSASNRHETLDIISSLSSSEYLTIGSSSMMLDQKEFEDGFDEEEDEDEDDEDDEVDNDEEDDEDEEVAKANYNSQHQKQYDEEYDEVELRNTTKSSSLNKTVTPTIPQSQPQSFHALSLPIPSQTQTSSLVTEVTGVEYKRTEIMASYVPATRADLSWTTISRPIIVVPGRDVILVDSERTPIEDEVDDDYSNGTYGDEIVERTIQTPTSGSTNPHRRSVHHRSGSFQSENSRSVTSGSQQRRGKEKEKITDVQDKRLHKPVQWQKASSESSLSKTKHSTSSNNSSRSPPTKDSFNVSETNNTRRCFSDATEATTSVTTMDPVISIRDSLNYSPKTNRKGYYPKSSGCSGGGEEGSFYHRRTVLHSPDENDDDEHHEQTSDDENAVLNVRKNRHAFVPQNVIVVVTDDDDDQDEDNHPHNKSPENYDNDKFCSIRNERAEDGIVYIDDSIPTCATRVDKNLVNELSESSSQVSILKSQIPDRRKQSIGSNESGLNDVLCHEEGTGDPDVVPLGTKDKTMSLDSRTLGTSSYLISTTANDNSRISSKTKNRSISLDPYRKLHILSDQNPSQLMDCRSLPSTTRDFSSLQKRGNTKDYVTKVKAGHVSCNGISGTSSTRPSETPDETIITCLSKSSYGSRDNSLNSAAGQESNLSNQCVPSKRSTSSMKSLSNRSRHKSNSVQSDLKDDALSCNGSRAQDDTSSKRSERDSSSLRLKQQTKRQEEDAAALSTDDSSRNNKINRRNSHGNSIEQKKSNNDEKFDIESADPRNECPMIIRLESSNFNEDGSCDSVIESDGDASDLETLNKSYVHLPGKSKLKIKKSSSTIATSETTKITKSSNGAEIISLSEYDCFDSTQSDGQERTNSKSRPSVSRANNSPTNNSCPNSSTRVVLATDSFKSSQSNDYKNDNTQNVSLYSIKKQRRTTSLLGKGGESCSLGTQKSPKFSKDRSKISELDCKAQPVKSEEKDVPSSVTQRLSDQLKLTHEPISWAMSKASKRSKSRSSSSCNPTQKSLETDFDCFESLHTSLSQALIRSNQDHPHKDDASKSSSHTVCPLVVNDELKSLLLDKPNSVINGDNCSYSQDSTSVMVVPKSIEVADRDDLDLFSYCSISRNSVQYLGSKTNVDEKPDGKDTGSRQGHDTILEASLSYPVGSKEQPPKLKNDAYSSTKPASKDTHRNPIASKWNRPSDDGHTLSIRKTSLSTGHDDIEDSVDLYNSYWHRKVPTKKRVSKESVNDFNSAKHSLGTEHDDWANECGASSSETKNVSETFDSLSHKAVELCSNTAKTSDGDSYKSKTAVLLRSNSNSSSDKRSDTSQSVVECIIPIVPVKHIEENPDPNQGKQENQQTKIERKSVDAPETHDIVNLCWSDEELRSVNIPIIKVEDEHSGDKLSELRSDKRTDRSEFERIESFPVTKRKYFSPLAILEDRDRQQKSVDPPCYSEQHTISLLAYTPDPPIYSGSKISSEAPEKRRLDPEGQQSTIVEAKGKLSKSFHSLETTKQGQCPRRRKYEFNTRSPNPTSKSRVQGKSHPRDGKVESDENLLSSLVEHFVAASTKKETHDVMIALVDLVETASTENENLVIVKNEEITPKRTSPKQETIASDKRSVASTKRTSLQSISPAHKSRTRNNNTAAASICNVLSAATSRKSSKLALGQTYLPVPCIDVIDVSASVDVSGLDRPLGDDETIESSIEDIWTRPDRYVPAVCDFDDGVEFMDHAVKTSCPADNGSLKALATKVECTESKSPRNRCHSQKKKSIVNETHDNAIKALAPSSGDFLATVTSRVKQNPTDDQNLKVIVHQPMLRNSSRHSMSSSDSSHDSFGNTIRTYQTDESLADSIFPLGVDTYERKKLLWRQKKREQIGRVTFDNIITEVSLDALDSQETGDLAMDMIFGTCNQSPLDRRLVNRMFGWN